MELSFERGSPDLKGQRSSGEGDDSAVDQHVSGEGIHHPRLRRPAA